MCEHGWVVCSPGDPNDHQLAAIHSMAGSSRFCAERWHADAGDVEFTVYRPTLWVTYIVDSNGSTRVARSATP